MDNNSATGNLHACTCMHIGLCAKSMHLRPAQPCVHISNSDIPDRDRHVRTYARTSRANALSNNYRLIPRFMSVIDVHIIPLDLPAEMCRVRGHVE